MLPTVTSRARLRGDRTPGGLGLERASSPLCAKRLRAARSVASLRVGRDDVEQQDGDAGVGEVRGDARAHDARADHRRA